MKSPLLYLTLLGTVLSVSAHSQFRKYSNEFLNIGAGARGLAMGSSQVASVQDGTAGYWNPAGLVGVKENTQINLMHAEYFAGIGKYDFASIAFPSVNNKRTFAITGLRFAVDDIMNTLFLVEPDGTINYNNIQAFFFCRLRFPAFLRTTPAGYRKAESAVWRKRKSNSPQCGQIRQSLGFWSGCRHPGAPGKMALRTYRPRHYHHFQLVGLHILPSGKRKPFT
ncbi:MAG: hypothetical protein NVV59_11605 [Chitinophagaceae bacterium]|nr:hypothetical protein [Chitinophagaceae bacterium]